MDSHTIESDKVVKEGPLKPTEFVYKASGIIPEDNIEAVAAIVNETLKEQLIDTGAGENSSASTSGSKDGALDHVGAAGNIETVPETQEQP
ncbi:hypothetical protein RIF29_00256 [Crotalaria pallida]|uniref:Uncharacterized protein n=1 Tax=Crotalaria pallida TaxID=3830 RepID=A0AAN9P7C2_CROPI